MLDWELSTLGHPLADFTYHLMMYRMPAGITTGLAGLDLAALNIPSEADYVAAYCRRTGRDGIADLDFYMAFNLFRLAGIVHGIKGRLVRGTAASAHAGEHGRHASSRSPSSPGRRRGRPARAESCAHRLQLPLSFALSRLPAARRHRMAEADGRRLDRRLRRAIAADRPGAPARHPALPRRRPLRRPLHWDLPLASDAERALYDLRFYRTAERTLEQDQRIVLVTYNDETLRAARQALAARPPDARRRARARSTR